MQPGNLSFRFVCRYHFGFCRQPAGRKLSADVLAMLGGFVAHRARNDQFERASMFVAPRGWIVILPRIHHRADIVALLRVALFLFLRREFFPTQVGDFCHAQWRELDDLLPRPFREGRFSFH